MNVDIALPHSEFFSLDRTTAQCLHAEGRGPDFIHIAYDAIDNQPGPTIGRRLLRQHIAQQGAAPGTAAVHHDDATLPRFLYTLF